MGFAERAVRACDEAMANGVVTERHARDILKCDHVDVSVIEKHFQSTDSTVRMLAASIIGQKGKSIESLLNAAMCEKNVSVLLAMLTELGKRKDGVEKLRQFINEDDVIIRDAAIDMFRRAGKPNSLFPLLFDKDDLVVQRIKRYLDEQKGQTREESRI